MTDLYGSENIRNRYPEIPVTVMRLIRTTVNLNVQFVMVFITHFSSYPIFISYFTVLYMENKFILEP